MRIRRFQRETSKALEVLVRILESLISKVNPGIPVGILEFPVRIERRYCGVFGGAVQ